MSGADFDMGLERKEFGRAHVTIEYLDGIHSKHEFTADNVLYTETTLYRRENGKTVKDYTEYVIRCQAPPSDQD